MVLKVPRYLWAIPAQSQREGRSENLQMEGTQVPTYSLTAGANTVQFGGLEARGVDGEGWLQKVKCQSKLRI